MEIVFTQKEVIAILNDTATAMLTEHNDHNVRMELDNRAYMSDEFRFKPVEYAPEEDNIYDAIKEEYKEFEDER